MINIIYTRNKEKLILEGKTNKNYQFEKPRNGILKKQTHILNMQEEETQTKVTGMIKHWPRETETEEQTCTVNVVETRETVTVIVIYNRS